MLYITFISLKTLVNFNTINKDYRSWLNPLPTDVEKNPHTGW